MPLEYSSMFFGVAFVAIPAFVCYVGAYPPMRGREALVTVEPAPATG